MNLTFDPVPFEDVALGVKVHRGVYHTAMALYERFLPLVMEHLASSPFAKIAFTVRHFILLSALLSPPFHFPPSSFASSPFAKVSFPVRHPSLLCPSVSTLLIQPSSFAKIFVMGALNLRLFTSAHRFSPGSP